MKQDWLYKYRYIIGGAVALSIIGVVVYLTKKGKNKNSENPKIGKKILFVGDSQTAIVGANGKPITFTYPNIIKKELEPQGFTIDVMAKGGMTTSWILDNLPKQLKNNKYDRVYIYGGGNDTSSKVDLDKVTLPNIQKMVDLSIENGADAYVNLGYKVDGFADYKKMPLTPYINKKEDWIPYIERRKELQKKIPNVIKNARFIPIYDLGTKTTDGIHPTAEGQKIVAENFLKSIKNL
jgi:acyl-CoA thioesterase-1